MKVMIVVCRQFVIVGIVVIVAVVLLLRLVLWCDNICGCFAWKMQYLGNQRGIFAPNIFLSPGKMFIGCRDIQFFARSQGFPFFHRVSSPSRDLLPLFLTTIHNDSHRSMVNLSSIVVIKWTVEMFLVFCWFRFKLHLCKVWTVNPTLRHVNKCL